MLTPWKESYDQTRSHIKKQRHYFANKGPSSQGLVFPMVMYGMDVSWTIKKARQWSIDAFELWCWRRPLRVSWTARRSNQSILKEVNAEYSLEGLILKLKLQYFGHLMQRAKLLQKTLVVGRIKDRDDRGQGSWMASSTQWTCVWTNSGRQWRAGETGALQSMGSQKVGPDLVKEQEPTNNLTWAHILIRKKDTINRW